MVGVRYFSFLRQLFTRLQLVVSGSIASYCREKYCYKIIHLKHTAHIESVGDLVDFWVMPFDQ
jgi:hypothetical protein